MNLIENSHFDSDLDKFGSDIPISPQEDFVNNVYASVDETIEFELDRLRIKEGIIPTCKLGCCYCCWYHILTNIAEAYTLAQYVKREWSPDQINDLRLRTQQWHEWENSRPGRHVSANIKAQTDLSSYDHCCPLLVKGACSVYPVRPVMCRTYFVCSPPLSCFTANGPESAKGAPVKLTSIVAATSPFSTAIKNHIETEDLDCSRSTMLLPHGLAIHMGWSFAISI